MLLALVALETRGIFAAGFHPLSFLSRPQTKRALITESTRTCKQCDHDLSLNPTGTVNDKEGARLAASSGAASNQTAVATNEQDADSARCFNDLEQQPITNFREVWHTQLDDIVGDWYFNGQVKIISDDQLETTAAGKFFIALSRAGYFSKKSETESLPKAIELMTAVSALDRDNSAPLLYLGLMEKKRGDLARAETYFQAAKKTRYFNSYLGQVNKAAYRLLKNPQEFITLYGMLSETPIPDYNDLRDWILEHREPFFAYQLMRDGLNPDNRVEMGEWILIEYATGYYILKKLNLLGDQLPYPQLVHKKNDPVGGAFREMVKNSRWKRCELNDLWPVVKEVEKRFGS